MIVTKNGKIRLSYSKAKSIYINDSNSIQYRSTSYVLDKHKTFYLCYWNRDLNYTNMCKIKFSIIDTIRFSIFYIRSIIKKENAVKVENATEFCENFTRNTVERWKDYHK